MDAAGVFAYPAAEEASPMHVDDTDRRRDQRRARARDLARRDRGHDAHGQGDRRGVAPRLHPRHDGDWDGWDDLPARRPTQRDRRSFIGIG
jgi:hypothetical protein